MQERKKLSLSEITGELKIYFNWSTNALLPIYPGAADNYLILNRAIICKVAKELLKEINYKPGPIYRGVILRNPVDLIVPHENFQYLSFSTQRSVAEHFANVKGFGSDIVDVEAQLGKYGYVIEHMPSIEEILFHYEFLSILPYSDAFTLLGMPGQMEVEGLKKQQEIMILQPAKPFRNIIIFP